MRRAHKFKPNSGEQIRKIITKWKQATTAIARRKGLRPRVLAHEASHSVKPQPVRSRAAQPCDALKYVMKKLMKVSPEQLSTFAPEPRSIPGGYPYAKDHYCSQNKSRIMSSGSENPPPSYNEATSQATSGSLRDEVRPEGWVEGYVEPPRAAHQASEYRPPAAATEKPAQATGIAALDGERGNAAEESAQDTATDQSRSRLAFGGLDLGGRVLGYGSGNDVGGWGVKIGPVLFGLVDVEEEKQRREREEGGRS
ncbi:uncharacterized protein LMH87_007904 [Akanthomyces muscarius]|uniref:Uncharacterized protein n=1 Tax=Akanthomyces muscarius TaxID=2231603 RepID=A0A9W8QM49_AKAMU|nr:uncharacterized protein LMH87_007904 [Akanthomyces muscarius]KAJ4159969.1 hypothetical protein LMH87_007904 [Akanthomyces muscarius]